MPVRTPRPVVLTTEDVAITTASVTLKTVQVNNRQMTQSIFRQLETFNFINLDKCEITGVPWGYVNYTWGDMDGGSRNFLIQNGLRLFRWAFRIRRSYTFFRRETYLMPGPFEKIKNSYLHHAKMLATAKYIECEKNKFGSGDIRYHFRYGPFDIDGSGILDFHSRFQAQDKLCVAYGRLVGPDEIQEKIDQLAADFFEHAARWDKLMDRLELIEQLFIAA